MPDDLLDAPLLRAVDADGLPRPRGRRARGPRRGGRRRGPLDLRRTARPLPTPGRCAGAAGRREAGRRSRAQHARAARGELRRAVGRRAARRDQHPAVGRRGRLHPRALGGGGAHPRPELRGTDRRRVLVDGRAAAAHPGGRGIRGDDPGRRAHRAPAGRRARSALDQLHVRHDRQAQGRDVPPPRRVPAGPRHGRAHRPLAECGAPVDAADVPLQRLVLPLGGHRRRRHPRLPAQGRAGAGVAADPRRGRHAPQRRAGRAVDARLRRRGRAAGEHGAGGDRRARRRRRRSCAGWANSVSTSRTSTG